MEKVTFNIPSISCSSCAGKIQEGLRDMPGIGETTVDLKAQSLNVSFDTARINANDIRGKITGMGYEVS